MTLRDTDIGETEITDDTEKLALKLSGENTCSLLWSDAAVLGISGETDRDLLTIAAEETSAIYASGEVVFEGGTITAQAEETAVYAEKIVVNGASLNAAVSIGSSDGAVIFAQSSIEMLVGSVCTSKPDEAGLYDVGVPDDGTIILGERIEIDGNTLYSKEPTDKRGSGAGDHEGTGGNGTGDGTGTGENGSGDSAVTGGNGSGDSAGTGGSGIGGSPQQGNAIGDVLTDSSGTVSYKIVGANSVVVYSAAQKGMKSAEIPGTVTLGGKKYKVTGISANAFQGCKRLTKIVIGKNVVKIGKNAFKNCKKMKTITIKTTKLSRKSIDAGAWKGIYRKAAFQCPKKQLKKYRKWIKGAGAPRKAKYKKR